MRPSNLSEMNAIKLMNRIDTKFIANKDSLLTILTLAKAGYRVQEINDERITSYDTIYFDTEDVAMYLRHHDRHLQRQKIRIWETPSNVGRAELFQSSSVAHVSWRTAGRTGTGALGCKDALRHAGRQGQGVLRQRGRSAKTRFVLSLVPAEENRRG